MLSPKRNNFLWQISLEKSSTPGLNHYITTVTCDVHYIPSIEWTRYAKELFTKLISLWYDISHWEQVSIKADFKRFKSKHLSLNFTQKKWRKTGRYKSENMSDWRSGFWRISASLKWVSEYPRLLNLTHDWLDFEHPDGETSASFVKEIGWTGEKQSPCLYLYKEASVTYLLQVCFFHTSQFEYMIWGLSCECFLEKMCSEIWIGANRRRNPPNKWKWLTQMS